MSPPVPPQRYHAKRNPHSHTTGHEGVNGRSLIKSTCWFTRIMWNIQMLNAVDMLQLKCISYLELSVGNAKMKTMRNIIISRMISWWSFSAPPAQKYSRWKLDNHGASLETAGIQQQNLTRTFSSLHSIHFPEIVLLSFLRVIGASSQQNNGVYTDWNLAYCRPETEIFVSGGRGKHRWRV